MFGVVSTHSRPKAAGSCWLKRCYKSIGFNTQPPEGGWVKSPPSIGLSAMFQHTAARRRLGPLEYIFKNCMPVSTHSRPKAAGKMQKVRFLVWVVSTHSRPKAAGTAHRLGCLVCDCFNTQPPEGGWNPSPCLWSPSACFNTQPPEGGWRVRALWRVS